MDEKRLEFAPTDEVVCREALVNEFVNEVLRLPWAFISDGSRLSDFQEVRTELELAQACYERYGLELEERHFHRTPSGMPRLFRAGGTEGRREYAAGYPAVCC